MAVLHVKTEDFDKEVIQSDIPVLVDFWATWCGPCQMVGPVLEEISSEVSDVKIVKVDVDENPELAQRFRVMSIPTMILFKNGEAVNTSIGAKPKADILNIIQG